MEPGLLLLQKRINAKYNSELSSTHNSFSLQPNIKIPTFKKDQSSFPIELDANILYKTMLKKKSVNLKIPNNKNITRNEMINKLSKTIDKLKFHQRTFHLAILLMDIIILSQRDRNIILLEQIALSSLILAIKYIEIDSNIPTLRSIQKVFGPYVFSPIDKLRKMEVYCLKQLKYKIQYYTPYDFICLFLLSTIRLLNDINIKFDCNNKKLFKQCIDNLKKILKKSNEYIAYKSESIALAIIIYSKYQTEFMINFKILKRDYNINKRDFEEANGYIIKCLSKSKVYQKSNSKVKKRENSLLSLKGYKTKNRSSSANTSSGAGEVSLNLKKIKEQSKYIRDNLFSFLSNDSNKQKDDIELSNSAKIHLYRLKMRVNSFVNSNSQSNLYREWDELIKKQNNRGCLNTIESSNRLAKRVNTFQSQRKKNIDIIGWKGNLNCLSATKSTRLVRDIKFEFKKKIQSN